MNVDSIYSYVIIFLKKMINTEILKSIKIEYEKFRPNLDKWEEIDRSLLGDKPDIVDYFLKSHTQYIKFYPMINEIKKVLLTNLIKGEKYYLWFPYQIKNLTTHKVKIGSENAIIIEVLDTLEYNVTPINDFINIPQNGKLLIIDDCIYTGKNLNCVLKNFELFNNNLNVELVFHSCNKNIITSLIKKFWEKHSVNYYFNEYKLFTDITKLFSQFPDAITPIIFDHKIHDSMLDMYSDLKNKPERIPAIITKYCCDVVINKILLIEEIDKKI